jgi:HEPN domain-containing protein
LNNNILNDKKMIRPKDWLRQSDNDIRMARVGKKESLFSWACFAAQQAAEKAIKALLQHYGVAIRGHSLTFLLQRIEKFHPIDAKVRDSAIRLEKYYIATRYPDSTSSGAPINHYTEQNANEAITDATIILDFCKIIMGVK